MSVSVTTEYPMFMLYILLFHFLSVSVAVC